MWKGVLLYCGGDGARMSAVVHDYMCVCETVTQFQKFLGHLMVASALVAGMKVNGVLAWALNGNWSKVASN